MGLVISPSFYHKWNYFLTAKCIYRYFWNMASIKSINVSDQYIQRTVDLVSIFLMSRKRNRKEFTLSKFQKQISYTCILIIRWSGCKHCPEQIFVPKWISVHVHNQQCRTVIGMLWAPVWSRVFFRSVWLW